MSTRAQHRCQARRAFTLIEVLVVMVVIAMLVGILLPVLGRAEGQAKLTQCRANLHQLGMAMTVYRQDSSGYTPPLYGWTAGEAVPGWNAHWPDRLFHQTDDHYSQGILTQRTAGVPPFSSPPDDSPEKLGMTGDWMSGPQHFIATGLGIIYRGGYMNRDSGSILTCPSYQFNLNIKGRELARIASKYRFDKDEAFWTVPQIVPTADGDNIQDVYGYDPDTSPPTWHVGVLTTSYWMRQNANLAMVNRPCWSSWNTRESRYSNIALVSDMLGARAGYNSYYHVDDSTGSLRHRFPYYDDANYPDAERESRFSGFYMQNHDLDYNVLFSDGSVKTFRDGGHALTKSIAPPDFSSPVSEAAANSSSRVAATFFEAFDGIYSAE